MKTLLQPIKITRRALQLAVLLMFCLLTAVPAVALADGVGKAIFVIGKATLTPKTGTPTLLRKGQILYPGDRIQTSEIGQVQIRMVDGAFMAIRPNSAFIIKDYKLSSNPKDNKSEFELIKGGFRAITGSIGKTNKSAYKVKTPVATLGIRGTDYVAVYCKNDCEQRRFRKGAGKVKNGLYVGVLSGGVYLRSHKGKVEVDKHEYGFVASSRSLPRLLEKAPEFLMFHTTPLMDEDKARDESDGRDKSNEHRYTDWGADDNEPGSHEHMQEVSDTHHDHEDSGPVFDPAEDLANNVKTEYRAFSYGLDGQVSNTGQVTAMTNDLELNAFSDTSSSSSEVLLMEQGSSVALDLGYDAVTGISWGRWADGAVSVTDFGSGQVSDVDLGNGSLHWISGPAEAAAVSLPTQGTASYVLIGNTNPTDNLGNTGVLGSASLNADFTNQTVDANLQLGINNQLWSAEGSNMAIGQNAGFAGSMDVTVVSGGVNSTSGSGQMAGTFVGPANTNGVPLGAGAVYSLTASPDGTNTTVSGVTAYEAQQ